MAKVRNRLLWELFLDTPIHLSLLKSLSMKATLLDFVCLETLGGRVSGQAIGLITRLYGHLNLEKQLDAQQKMMVHSTFNLKTILSNLLGQV
jgi:hypothetical protein